MRNPSWSATTVSPRPFLPPAYLQGRQYCFLSNIDNLGATVDTRILDLVLTPGKDAPEFVMEVTDKTKADVKVSVHPARAEASEQQRPTSPGAHT